MPLAHSHASPLSAWLRVPLEWYHSTTYAFFDDETHSSIRRVYTAPDEQSSKRHFCGFCGTPLSYWSESPPSEANYISLTLTSLTGEDLRDLEDLGLLPKELSDQGEDTEQILVRNTGGARQGLPWFESLIEGSTLSKVKRTSGNHQSADGRVSVKWEVVEWNDDGLDGDATSTSKRKHADLEGDSYMKELP